MSSQRLNVTLDGEHAAKLARLAERVHVNEGTLARSLLSSAIDDLDPDPANVASLLDGIDGAWQRAQLGLAQAEAGETISLDVLAPARTFAGLGVVRGSPESRRW